MKSVFGDSKTVRDGLIHYLLAEVLFAAFLGGSIQFIILVTLKGYALFAFQGIWGMLMDLTITWCSVLLSVSLMSRKQKIDSVGVAFTSTTFLLAVAAVSIPYLHILSAMSRVDISYLVMKEALHTCVFYTSTLIYFSGFSVRSLLKETLFAHH